MGQISDITDMVRDLLRGAGGLQTNIDALAALEMAPALDMSAGQVLTQNLPPDIADRNTTGQYPCIHVYCEKALNQMREKSRTFSGIAAMAIEARVSTDRVEDLDAQVNLLVDAVTATLDQNRGDWGAGAFYGGGYEITFDAVKRGGRGFIQIATITFNVDISR
jgi:hypothetical protein